MTASSQGRDLSHLKLMLRISKSKVKLTQLKNSHRAWKWN